MDFSVAWDEGWDTGLPDIDREHREMLDLCAQLQALAHAPGDAGFEPRVDQFKALVRRHLQAEGALLVQRGALDAEGAGEAIEAFDELADEVATPDHFDAVERHRFVAAWCLGHVSESARQLNGEPADDDTAT